MIDKITGQPAGHAQQTSEQAQASAARREPTPAQNATGRPETSDTVSLTDTAARLRAIEDRLAEQPVVDTQRVEKVQGAITDGSFKVEPVRVAGKLIDFETELNSLD